MAGLGEACSHVAAVLFTAEANTQTKRQFSSTSLPCSWLPTSFQFVNFSKVAEIDFKTPSMKRKLKVQADTVHCWQTAQPAVFSRNPTFSMNCTNPLGSPIRFGWKPIKVNSASFLVYIMTADCAAILNHITL